MSDVDSVLDFIMDEATAVSFAVVEDKRVARPSSPSPGAAACGVGVRSGIQGTMSGGKAYSVVSVTGSDRSVCFGIVGKGGGAFCIRKNCVFSSHEDAKISFQGKDETSFFICRGGERNTIIYSQPSIDARRVPVEVKQTWKDQQMTLAEWRLAFKAVENADDAGATVDEIKKEVTFLNDTSNFWTPSKKRKEMMMVSDDGSSLMGTVDVVGHVRTLPEDLTKELDDVITESIDKGLLTRIVARLESSMVTQGLALEAVAELSYKRFLSNEKDLREVAGAVQNVQTSVGQAIELETNFDAPTLWSATSFVAEEVERVAGGVKSLESSMIPMKASLKEVREEVAQMSKGGSSDKMLKVLVMVSTKVKEASSEITGLKAKVAAMETAMADHARSGRSLPEAKRHKESEMDDLMNMFGTTEVTVEKEGRGFRLSDERDVTEIVSILKSLKQLTADVGMLKAGTEDKSVKFAGLGWRSIVDCQEWIKVSFPSNRYGLIMDPLLILDRVFGSEDAEADSHFKTLESRVKLKIATGAEAAAIKALHFKRPRLFHSGQVAMSTDRNTSKLNKLTSHKIWKTGGEGVRNYIVHRMNLLLTTISQDISHVLGGDPKAQLLATMCLNATITFVTQLLAFVDSIYDKLVVASKFSAEQGWSLTMKILDRICEDLFAPKEGVVAAMNIEDPASICAHMLWSCFKTHDVMAGYMDANFENHPAISAEYVKFLALNSGFDKVEKLDSVMTSLKTLGEATSKEAAKARSIADGAASAAAAATKSVAEIMKRLVKAEGLIEKHGTAMNNKRS